jgi:hypothetical protein
MDCVIDNNNDDCCCSVCCDANVEQYTCVVLVFARLEIGDWRKEPTRLDSYDCDAHNTNCLCLISEHKKQCNNFRFSIFIAPVFRDPSIQVSNSNSRCYKYK